MTEGINLLKSEKQADIQLAELAHRLKVGSLVFLIFYCLVTLATFSYSIYTQQNYQKTLATIEAQKIKISELKKVESQQITLKQRLMVLTTFTSSKKISPDQTLAHFDKTLDPEVTIKEISAGESGITKISGQALQVVALGSFLEKLSQETFFQRITVSSMVRQKDGSYLFDLDLKTSE